MPKSSKPRAGSLQFWPRKRARKVLPSVNWREVQLFNPSSKSSGVLGFIAYKVGMASALLKDNTESSMTKGKRIILPVTILEAPNMKIFSVRFYNHGIVSNEIIVSNDKELKRKLSVPKVLGKLDNIPENYEDIRVIVYSLVSNTGIKKTPDFIELAINAPDNDKSKKLEFVKSLIGKEISLKDFLPNFKLLDVRGLTKGKGFSGPVKRFGIKYRFHKSEKGVKKVGSIAPWHPARVTFRAPMAGQLGMFSRVTYNLKPLFFSSISEKDINPSSGFKQYGKINSSYVIIKGSVQGPQKRAVILTPAFRPTKSQAKKNLEFIDIV